MRRPELTPARSRSRRAHHADATPPKAHRWIEVKSAHEYAWTGAVERYRCGMLIGYSRVSAIEQNLTVHRGTRYMGP